MPSNLPPGVTESMLPGNRPEDQAWDSAWDWLDKTVNKSDFTPDEFIRAVLIGMAGVKAEREMVDWAIKGGSR